MTDTIFKVVCYLQLCFENGCEKICIRFYRYTVRYFISGKTEDLKNLLQIQIEEGTEGEKETY